MFPYTPRKEDELELRKGEMFLVLERCQDGWFKGTSMHTGKIGVFPGNYMSPVNRSVFPLLLSSQTASEWRDALYLFPSHGSGFIRRP